MAIRSGGCLTRLLCCFGCACRGPIGLRPFLFGSKVNILFFICAPLTFIAEGNHWGAGPTFVLAMLAIAPLAERLGYLTEQLAFHTNDTLGGESKFSTTNKAAGSTVLTLELFTVFLQSNKECSMQHLETRWKP